MKIFKMNKCDWWMDSDIESAEKNYSAYMGMPEIECVEDPVELTEDDLDNHEYYPDWDVSKAMSFRKALKTVEHVPHLFASTEQ